MEASSVPRFAAFRFLLAPPQLPTPTCSRRNLPCVRDVPQKVEASEAPKVWRRSDRRSSEAPKARRLSHRRSVVATIKFSDDPVAALTRFEDVLRAQDCNIILRHCGDTRRWDDLSKVFVWMQERGMTNAASYSSYIKYLGLSHNPARALQVYGAIQDRYIKVDIPVCNSVLGCLVKNGMFESSFKLYDEMIQEGLSPDPFTYSTLLSGCTKFKQGYTKAMELVHELNSQGIQMTSVIYGTLLAICASHNYCEEAELYFQKMKGEGHTPNLFHYSSLLNAYSENANYEKAELLMKDLRSSGLTPNKVILTTLLKVYSKAGLFEKAKELLTELEVSGFTKDEMTYSFLIGNLVKASVDPVTTLTRFEDVLQAEGCNIILRHCGDTRRWDDLSKVFKWMQEREMTNAASYSCYFKNLGLCRNPTRALQVYGGIRDRSIRVQVGVCNSVLGCLVKNGRFENSFKLYDEMIREGLSPDLLTYSLLLSGCTKFKQGYTKAARLIHELNSRGIQMDDVIYGILIAIFASHNHCEEAEAYFHKMKDEGHTPNLFHYSSLLNAYSENANYEKAELLMKDLRSSGLTPNKVILTTLLKLYSKGGLFEKAKELLNELEVSG